MTTTAQDQHRDAPFRILSKREFVGDFVTPDYVVDGILQRRYLYSMTGKTGHGKTAIATRLASLVGSTAPTAFFGPHQVEKGKVLYLAGENPDDLRNRMIGDDAMSERDGSKDRINIIPGVFDIKQMFRRVEVEIRKLGTADLVIVDTSAAYSTCDDENNNAQMGNHARMLRTLTTLPGGPCVVVLCHPVKHANEPAQLLPRGGGAFLNEMDGNLTAWKQDGDLVEVWHTGKFRGPGFEPITFRLEKIKTPALVDSKGRMMPTVRAIAVSQEEQEAETVAARSAEDLLLIAMRIKGRSLAELAKACGWIFENGVPHKSKAQRIMERLVKDHLAELHRGEYQLTKSGKDAAEKAAAGNKTGAWPT